MKNQKRSAQKPEPAAGGAAKAGGRQTAKYSKPRIKSHGKISEVASAFKP